MSGKQTLGWEKWIGGQAEESGIAHCIYTDNLENVFFFFPLVL